ncbi:MAG: iron-sulfur cluster repair di-iron protein [Candidatus Melainabacteria bacterium]|nr:iron-sulfur cluster repair di-iron protein [Candidatus Melainabacteria bacterium]
MSIIDKKATIGQLVVERPSRARVFERFGIDYCCGGKRPLEEVCLEKGLDVEEVLVLLSDVTGGSNKGEQEDLSKKSLRELTEHIVNQHHATLKQELPRIASLLKKVVGVHGEHHTELKELSNVFGRFRCQLEMHMQKEEMVLFPMCQELEGAKRLPDFHCGSIGNPINVMMLEHDEAGNDLAAMRQLTNNYTPPADACGSYRALFDGLRELELDMHEHIHKENNILFPKAKGLEAGLAVR